VTEAHQERLLARADQSADAAEAAVRKVWLAILSAIRRGGPWFCVYHGVTAALRSLPAVGHAVSQDLAQAAHDSARWTAEGIAPRLPRTRLEDEGLAVGVALPSLTADEVTRVVYASGWAKRLQHLTALTAPESLASRIAAAVQRGLTVQQIARDIRPVVQNVQTTARRVARTAGLYVAHEAEMRTYEKLEGLVVGYRVRAVLDSRTRPEHRRRDGQEFYYHPRAGQRPMSECPHPPREADGTWAFNCRCFLTPILAVD